MGGGASVSKNKDNFIITFGCPPTSTVDARSTIARAYFEFLQETADEKGYIVLPGNLNYWNGEDGKCEHSLKVPSGPILLQWHETTAEEITNEKN